MFRLFNDIKLPKAPNDDTYKPKPFFPVSLLTTVSSRSELIPLAGDDEMSEERFNAVFKDPYVFIQ